jgi:excisionase family DNA binding protein
MSAADGRRTTTILTTAEVARWLKTSRYHLYRLVEAGKVPAFRVGNVYRFNVELLRRMVEQSDKYEP